MKAAWCIVVLAACACSGTTSPSTAQRDIAGQWSGVTSQGAPIAFTVSASETVTVISLGYNFNGCSGARTFADLDIPTAPNVTCIPGPCPTTVASYRALNFFEASRDGSRTSVNGLFTAGNHSEGQATFRDYPECGTATGVTWTATKR